MSVDYLRISVTDRCNFRCRYCMPPAGVALKRHGDILTFEEIVSFTRAAVDAGITRVRLTGGEPLVRRQFHELVRQLARIDGVRDLSLTTNGSLLARQAHVLRQAGLQRINISIDSLDPARFAAITRGGQLAAVLAGLERALEAGFEPVKVNTVMLTGIEAELQSFVALTQRLPVHIRFIEQMPIGRQPAAGGWSFIPRDRLLARLADSGNLLPETGPQGAGPARYWRLGNGPGTIGFISSMSAHFCGLCNRLRLTADGMLRNCLFSDEEIDVRPLIAAGREPLAAAIRAAIAGKRFDRRGSDPGARLMSQIGG